MQWFEQEIELAQREGVTHQGNLPFLLTPTQTNGQAVLLIHGFSSSPKEMSAVGEILLQHQFTVYGVRLPGHGTTPEDLATRHATEWFATIERGYLALLAMGFEISAAGLSTGALLTLKLALQQPLKKMILLSPFLQLKHPLSSFATPLSYLIPYQNKTISPEEAPFYYQRRPLKGVAQINTLCKQLSGQIHKITVPSLTLASSGDKTIAKGSAEKVYKKLGGRQKQFHCYGDDVPHVLTTAENPQQQDVLQRCINFFETSVES
ncbi:carboxylesterase [Desulfuromusa kysingii]|uniref:Carboxylesterase n=1 Tax=Desulfuromusa kysingii TaxID=37625 RepID=A0A1H3W090_9BACT|nr:alpha/beta fold hydrolase [Desulfuromusa kysingii]SDZ80390.1 carboxylesterase [Desulfuromusa kysingii]